MNYKFDIFTGLNSLFVALMGHPKFKRLDFSNCISLSGGMALMESVAEAGKKPQAVLLVRAMV